MPSRKNKLNKTCEVCGDLGIGRNFTVITCESCKAFFRRFGAKNKTLNCPSDGKCVINRLTRKMCQKCRLNKCFAVGMKKEFIRKAEENEERKQQIRDKKLRQTQFNNTIDCVVSSTTDSTDISTSDETIDDLLMFDEMSDKDILNELFDDSIDYLNTDDIKTDEDIIKIETFIMNSEIRDKVDLAINNINRNMHKMTIVPVFKELTDYSTLNQLESNRISELTLATSIFDYKCGNVVIKVDNLEELFKMSSNRQEDLISDVIKFTKCMNGFSNLCLEDRTTLVKKGYNELTSIRLFKFYNTSTECFSMPLDNENVLEAKLNIFQFGDFKYYELFKPYIEKFLSQWDYNDTIAIDLLTAIVLYNPNRPGLKNCHSVRLEQQLYIYLLQRYLLLKCGSDVECQTIVQKFMLTLKDLYNLNEIEMTIGLQWCKNYKHLLGPLMIEIYDL